jgi:hypothetical protein
MTETDNYHFTFERLLYPAVDTHTPCFSSKFSSSPSLHVTVLSLMTYIEYQMIPYKQKMMNSMLSIALQPGFKSSPFVLY